MNEPYTGGLGSYALLIMIISYLQVLPAFPFSLPQASLYMAAS